MKNLLLTLFTALMFSASFGQLDLEAKLVMPTADTIKATNVEFTLRIINRGTVAITATDTVFIEIFLDGTRQTGLYNAASVIAVGDSITFNPIRLNFGAHPSTALFQVACVEISAQGSLGADANTANNRDCYTIERSLASINESKLDDNTKVFVAEGVLKMSSTSNENLTFAVISLTGQVVSQGTFVSNKQIDLTGAAKGMYVVAVSNGTEKITKKVIVQ